MFPRLVNAIAGSKVAPPPSAGQRLLLWQHALQGGLQKSYGTRRRSGCVRRSGGPGVYLLRPRRVASNEVVIAVRPAKAISGERLHGATGASARPSSAANGRAREGKEWSTPPRPSRRSRGWGS